MTSYAWATDVHLDFIDSDRQIVAFAESLVERDPVGIILTGDISVANRVVYHLSAIERVVQRPVYFVLGNHDYYGGSIEAVRKSVTSACSMSQFLRYMPSLPYVQISQATALVGHDGWYDALHGDPRRSNFMMSDWHVIKDFRVHSGGEKFMVMSQRVKDIDGLVGLARKLAHEAVLHVQAGIKAASRYHRNIVVLTHFPPFAEAHVYKGAPADADALPWYTSKLMGDMLLGAARALPNVQFTVLAGHTHGRYDGQPAPNLQVHVGGADYGRPAIAGMLDLS